jgi:4-amino-4-deoxy-L-arabinose transferase-like glycosyltransferase
MRVHSIFSSPHRQRRQALPLIGDARGRKTQDPTQTWSALPRSTLTDHGVTITVLLAVTGLALLLRIINFQGFLGGDDATYIRDARLLAQGRFIPGSNQWDVRIGIIAPTTLALRLFGLHEWSIVLYPLCLSLLSLPLIYFLGKAFCCRQVGVLAALLLACFPQDVVYATSVYPDLPGAFWGALAVLLAYLSRAAAPPARRKGLAVGCGLALAVSYLTWEAYVAFVPICLLTLWGDRARDTSRKAGVILATLTCALAIESLVYWRLVGSPVFRLAALHHHVALLHGTSPLHFLLRWPAVLLNPGYPQTFFYVLLSIWGIVGLRRRRVRLAERILLLWLLGTCALYAFAVISIRPLMALLDVEPRYLSGVVYPAIVLSARALWETRPQGRTLQE